MFLKQLKLTNFRNYSQLELLFDSRPTILVGNNAAGKSNILEAIYLLSTSKSQRVENEDELIKHQQQFTRVEGFLADPETELMVLINRPSEQVNFRKKVLVNGISKRVVEFLGNLPAVIFYPSDINMVTGAPNLRRWHLDLTLAQIDPVYKKNLTLYEQFLTARNRVLKRIREGGGRLDELDYWTVELVKLGEDIRKKREEFFQFINNLQTPLGNFKFEYIQSPISLDKLKETNGREIAAAATLIGPHREDFQIVLYDVIPARFAEASARRANAGIQLNDSANNLLDPRSSSLSDEAFRLRVDDLRGDDKGRDMAHFGSRGEQRTATLAFKLAQLEYMAKILGKRPILLLDDVFSELDVSHRAHVVESVTKQQTIIATVELENIPQEFLNSARILRVEDGQVKGD